MTEIFRPMAADNILPYDGHVNDLGVVIENGDSLYHRLLQELPWHADVVTLFGKTHTTTRQIVWMGENQTLYRYAGQTHRAIPWSKSVFHVKQYIEQQLLTIGIEVDFNTCLLNHYPSGMEGMGYHADDEKALGAQPIIAALSLGATRKFVLKHRKTQEKVERHLTSGQLIVMHGETQQFWRHTITKTKKVATGRISLTFRQTQAD